MENTQNEDRHHKYNLVHERAILSSIIFSPELIGDIELRLQPHHLYLEAHQKIYASILKLRRTDIPIDEVFIDQDTQGKYTNLITEIMAVNPIAMIYPYINQIIEYHSQRELRRLSTVILQAIEEEKTSEMIIGEVTRYVDKIETSTHSRSKTFDELKEAWLTTPRPPLYETGVSFIDRAFGGGLKMGHLVLISGDPEAGKTMLVMQILKNVSKNAPVCLFAFEFTVDSMIELQLDTEGKNYQNPNLHIIDDGFDILDIEAEIKGKAAIGVKFFVIDSQMRIENASNNGTMEERESEKFSRLAKLSHRLKILILCIIQNSKSDTSAGIIAPMGSKKGAHEASVIMHLKRLKDDPENGKKEMRELIVNKNKMNGVHFKGEISFNPVTKRFTTPYGESGSAEYSGHKPKGSIPVEHQDNHGNTTSVSSMERTQNNLMDIESSEIINIPFIGE